MVYLDLALKDVPKMPSINQMLSSDFAKKRDNLDRRYSLKAAKQLTHKFLKWPEAYTSERLRLLHLGLLGKLALMIKKILEDEKDDDGYDKFVNKNVPPPLAKASPRSKRLSTKLARLDKINE